MSLLGRNYTSLSELECEMLAVLQDRYRDIRRWLFKVSELDRIRALFHSFPHRDLSGRMLPERRLNETL